MNRLMIEKRIRAIYAIVPSCAFKLDDDGMIKVFVPAESKPSELDINVKMIEMDEQRAAIRDKEEKTKREYEDSLSGALYAQLKAMSPSQRAEWINANIDGNRSVKEALSMIVEVMFSILGKSV